MSWMPNCPCEDCTKIRTLIRDAAELLRCEASPYWINQDHWDDQADRWLKVFAEVGQPVTHK